MLQSILLQISFSSFLLPSFLISFLFLSFLVFLFFLAVASAAVDRCSGMVWGETPQGLCTSLLAHTHYTLPPPPHVCMCTLGFWGERISITFAPCWKRIVCTTHHSCTPQGWHFFLWHLMHRNGEREEVKVYVCVSECVCGWVGAECMCVWWACACACVRVCVCVCVFISGGGVAQGEKGSQSACVGLSVCVGSMCECVCVWEWDCVCVCLLFLMFLFSLPKKPEKGPSIHG